MLNIVFIIVIEQTGMSIQGNIETAISHATKQKKKCWGHDFVFSCLTFDV